jgi:glycosyltransferase involved in cell wall biosynthesis
MDILEKCPKTVTQVVVVLDGELDEEIYSVRNLLTTFGAEVVVGNFQNPGTSRNEGLKRALGDWVVFWDVDDLPNVSEVLNVISEHSDFYGVIIGDFSIDKITRGKRKTVILRSDKTIANNPGIWRMIFRKVTLAGVNFPLYSLGEDQVYLAKIFGSHPPWLYVPKILYEYRVGLQDQLTSGGEKKKHIADRFFAAMDIKDIALLTRDQCYLCKTIRAMSARMSLGCLHALGVTGRIKGIGFIKARLMLLHLFLSSRFTCTFSSRNDAKKG